MLGPAHVAVGAACYALTRHPVGFVAGLLLHPALDLLGAWHEPDFMSLDTWSKRLMFYVGLACMAVLALDCNVLALAAGALAWVGADWQWAVREIWPHSWLTRTGVPHTWWWLRGQEFRRQWWGMAVELALTLGCTAAVVLA